jgi:hypothetical protein
MTLGLLFWILMLIWLVVYGLLRYQATPQPAWPSVFPDVMVFLLFLCLGWKTFGSPIQ